MTTLYEHSTPSPVGRLRLVADDDALLAVYFPEHRHAHAFPDARDGSGHPVLVETARQLAEYFAGGRVRFELPLRPRGTDFQLTVWEALRAIPFGVTRSYAELASALGRPSAVRAVGAANGRNPHSILVPCHRVIGADGSLTGYGGGLPTKQWLLRHERARPAEGELALVFAPGA